MPRETSLTSKRKPFDEIRLMNKHAVRWRFVIAANRWEIAAYDTTAGGSLLPSVTGEPILAWTRQGPSSDEFSEALGKVVMDASLKVQSKRIDGRRSAG